MHLTKTIHQFLWFSLSTAFSYCPPLHLLEAEGVTSQTQTGHCASLQGCVHADHLGWSYGTGTPPGTACKSVLVALKCPRALPLSAGGENCEYSILEFGNDGKVNQACCSDVHLDGATSRLEIRSHIQAPEALKEEEEEDANAEADEENSEEYDYLEEEEEGEEEETEGLSLEDLEIPREHLEEEGDGEPVENDGQLWEPQEGEYYQEVVNVE